MVRGYYTAASGMLSQQRTFNVVSSNIANLTTAGYKGENLIHSSFAEHLVARVGDGNINQTRNIGPGSFFTSNVGEYINFTQGNLEETGRELDMAISGIGFFQIETANKGNVLTRNGQFDLDAEGHLVLPGVGYVLNPEGERIVVSDSSFHVDQEGIIRIDGEEVERIGIVAVEDAATLENAGEGVYRNTTELFAPSNKDYVIMQKYIEKTNVNMASEMAKVIAGQNYFTSCSQVLKIYDTLNQTLVTQIGRVG